MEKRSEGVERAGEEGSTKMKRAWKLQHMNCTDTNIPTSGTSVMGVVFARCFLCSITASDSFSKCRQNLLGLYFLVSPPPPPPGPGLRDTLVEVTGCEFSLVKSWLPSLVTGWSWERSECKSFSLSASRASSSPNFTPE